MWLLGAASDSLAAMLGDDDPCCGRTPIPSGCGNCLLVQNPDAVNAGWTAVVMKKNRCPPWTNGCGDGELHVDIAAPGFDFLPESTANVCGERAGTGFDTRSRANYSADGGKAVPTRASALSCATSFRHRSSPAAGCSPPGAGRAETRRGSGSGRWHAQTPSERTSAHSSGRRGRCCRPLRHRPPLRRRRRPLLPSRRCRRPLLLLPRHRLHILAAPAWSCSKTTATGWTARAATARVRPEARRSLAPPTSRLWGMAVRSPAKRLWSPPTNTCQTCLLPPPPQLLGVAHPTHGSSPTPLNTDLFVGSSFSSTPTDCLCLRSCNIRATMEDGLFQRGSNGAVFEYDMTCNINPGCGCGCSASANQLTLCRAPA